MMYGKGHAYKRDDITAYETAVQYMVRTVLKSPLTGALRVDVYFYIPIPKSWSESKKRLAEQGLVLPTVTPDIDNLQKMILDCLKGGIAFNDDKQIVDISAHKRYGEPKTVIELEELIWAIK